MADSDESPSKALIEIKDFFGASAPATAIVQAIALGVGNFLGPGQRRRDARADVEVYQMWRQALEESGVATDSASLTLEDRATIRWTADSIRHQENRESIAREAIRDFKQLPGPSRTEQEASPIDTEWVDRFWRHAECVSDADLQELWGRILSRKISGASPISARALEFLSTLSSQEARELEVISRYAYRGCKADGSIEMGVIRGMKRHHQEPFDIAEDSMDVLNRRLVDRTTLLQFDHFGALGLLIEDGFSQTFALPVRDNTIELSISRQPLWLVGREKPLVPNNQANYMNFASGRAVTRLGRDIIDMLVSSPDMEYISTMQEIARAYGNELIIGD